MAKERQGPKCPLSHCSGRHNRAAFQARPGVGAAFAARHFGTMLRDTEIEHLDVFFAPAFHPVVMLLCSSRLVF